MPRLLYAPASPYSAKVRMAAAAVGFEMDAEVVETGRDPQDLIAANPLGKIPVLVLDDGQAVFDSRVILRHLDRLSGGKLFPAEPAALLAAERLEALADGVCDCLLAHVYERRARPEDKIHPPWLDRQWEKAARGLDRLAGDLPAPDAEAGAIALRAALGYCALRFAGRWEAGREGLAAWAGRFDAAWPDLVPLLPR